MDTCGSRIAAALKVVLRFVVWLLVQHGDVAKASLGQVDGAAQAKHAGADNDNGGVLICQGRRHYFIRSGYLLKLKHFPVLGRKEGEKKKDGKKRITTGMGFEPMISKEQDFESCALTTRPPCPGFPYCQDSSDILMNTTSCTMDFDNLHHI
jgi:hypothetical protein